jgi:hypothetical protein
VDSNIDVNALTLNSADATIAQMSGVVQSGAINLDAGTYELIGSTIANSTINLNGGTVAFRNGVLSGDTVSGASLQVDGNLIVKNGLTLADQNLYLGSSGYVQFDGSNGNAEIDNINISLHLDRSGGTVLPGAVQVSGLDSTGSQTLTLGSGVVANGIVFYSWYPTDALVNNGLLIGAEISADNFTNNAKMEAMSGEPLGIHDVIGGTWSNGTNGVISANQSTVKLGGNWSNSGSIVVTNGSTAFLFGTFTAPGMGNISVDSTSTINISGTVTNAGATLSYGGASAFTIGSNAPGIVYVGPYYLPDETSAATVVGGTVDNSSGNVSIIGEALLNGVSVTGGDLKNSGTLYVANGVTIGDHNLDLSVGSTLYFDGTNQGVDNVNISGAFATGPVARLFVAEGSSAPQTFTLGSNALVHGAINILSTNAGSTLINRGTINADAPYNYLTQPNELTITTGNFINDGLLEVTNGAHLSIGGTNFTNNGTVALHNGEIYDPSSNLNFSSGVLEGSGDIIANSIILSGNTTLVLELRSASDYDSLAIPAGTALNGDLEVKLDNEFVPSSSATFVILDANLLYSSPLTGTFMNLPDGGRFETTDGSGSFAINYSQTQVVLSDFQSTSVPEPISIGMTAVLAGSMLLRRKRLDLLWQLGLMLI